MMSKMDLPDSFDDFFKEESKNDGAEETIYSKFAKERIEWGNKIKNMSSKIAKIFDLSELMTFIYTERQIAIEYYYYLISLLIKLNKIYRTKYSEKYNFYSYQSQKRFPNETVKNNHIMAELADIVSKREALDNHSKFMLETLKTIDNIIYGIKNRIDLEKIAKGIGI